MSIQKISINGNSQFTGLYKAQLVPFQFDVDKNVTDANVYINYDQGIVYWKPGPTIVIYTERGYNTYSNPAGTVEDDDIIEIDNKLYRFSIIDKEYVHYLHYLFFNADTKQFILKGYYDVPNYIQDNANIYTVGTGALVSKHMRFATFGPLIVNGSPIYYPTDLTSVQSQIDTINTHITTIDQELDNLDAKKLNGKKLSILGDSISTFQGYLPSDISGYDGSTYAKWYPSGTVTQVQQTWWYKLCSETNMTLLRNCSWSDSECQGNGTSSSSAQAGCSDRRISDLSDGTNNPDIVIVFIGVNDWGHGKSMGTFDYNAEIPTNGTISNFSDAYILMLDKIMTSYPTTKIFCCTLLNTGYGNYDSYQPTPGTYPAINRNGVALYEFNQTIKNICSSMGVYVIDLVECGFNFKNFTQYTIGDKLHPNEAGHILIKNYIKNQLLLHY